MHPVLFPLLAATPGPPLSGGAVEVALLAATVALVAAAAAIAFASRRVSLSLLVVAVVGLALAGWQAVRLDASDHLHAQHQSVANELLDIQAHLEHALYEDANVLEAMAAHIALSSDLDEQRFAEVAAHLLHGHDRLTNLAAAPDLVVRYVYPRAGNERLLGFDYRANPAQRDAALRAFEARGPVLAGPIDLVQGGRGLIARLAVRRTEQGGAEEAWGLVSTVIDVDRLLESARLSEHPDVAVALRGRDGLGEAGQVFLGDAELFAGEGERLRVNLPVGSWSLAGRPATGWDMRAPAGAFFVLVTGATILAVLGLYLGRRRHAAERRRAEGALRGARDDALAAGRAKGRFLANMSHEIRTPMNGVLGAAQLLADTTLDGEQKELADIIRDSARSLLTILDDVLDLAKVEAGRLAIMEEPLALRALFGEVADLLRPAATAKGITVADEIADDVPDRVVSDPVRLRQILLNLGSNAVKFTEVGGVTFAAERQPSPDGPRLMLSVADTGIGLTEEQQVRIFDPFAQADDSTTRRYGGTGLGTTISRHLTELLGGRLTVESAPGRGSIFRATLPLVEAPARETPVRAETTTASARGRVLLAEDNPVNARIGTLLLERLGVSVAHVPDGAAALAAAEEADLVLMDVSMPLMDGLEATRRLREAGYHRPIVALTANVMPEDRAACLAAGMNDVLGKPIVAGALAALIDRWLGEPAEAAVTPLSASRLSASRLSALPPAPKPD